MGRIVNILFLMEPQVTEIAFGLDPSWRWWKKGMSVTIRCSYIFSWPREQMRAAAGQAVLLYWMLTNEEAPLEGSSRDALPRCGAMGTEQGPWSLFLDKSDKMCFLCMNLGGRAE